MIKRNSIVLVNSFYGRVVKKLPNGRWLVLTSGLHFFAVPKDYPESDYKGYSYTRYDGKPSNRFVYMTTLRNLKRRARQYHREFAHNTPADYEYIREE